MNLQSRSNRWLAAAELSKSFTNGILQSEQFYRDGGKSMPQQAHELFCRKMMDHLRLTVEAEPLTQDAPLYNVLSDVVESLNGLKVGPDFRSSVEALDAALGSAVSSLRDWTSGEDTKIEDIVDELERAFLISLFVTLTSHTFVTNWSDEWQKHHEEFLDGKKSEDLPHYVHLPTFLPTPDSGPGRIHVQQLHSAVRAGTAVFIAGASTTEVDHYPELQSIVYSQWFAYMHAIWDEQFRERIASFYSTPEQPLEKNDVINDFFGDIRRIRNDFVHRKGIADEAAKVKVLAWGFTKGKPLDITTGQMLSLVDLFPRKALTLKPTTRPAQSRKNVPGSGNATLIDRFLSITSELKIDKSVAIDEALTLWLNAKDPDHEPA